MARRRVLVIGAGVIGSATAMRMAENGGQVTVVDAALPGQGTSGSSFAWINSNAKTPRAYFELNVAGMAAHRELAGEFGRAPWFHPVGNLEWAADDDGRSALQAKLERLGDWRYAVRLMDHNQAQELEPGLRLPEDVAEVAFYPEEGFVFTAQLIEQLLDRTLAAGATLITGDPVVAFETDGRRLTGARLRSGRHIPSDTFVLSAGWHTPALAALAGVAIPLLSPDAPGSPAVALVASTMPMTRPLRRLIHAPNVNARPTDTGGLLLEHEEMEETIGFDTITDPPPPGAVELLHRARRLVPALENTELRGAEICIRPLPTDGYPIVGRCPEIEACYVVVTHSGVTLAPYLAKLVANEVLNDADEQILAPYRPQRFREPGGSLLNRELV